MDFFETQYPGYFSTGYGRVFRSTNDGFVMCAIKHQKGYEYCSVKVSGKWKWLRTNRIVCQTFHGNPSNPDLMARHLDDDKSNNKPDNLAWGTAQDNVDDAKRNGKRNRPPTGERHGMAKLSDNDVIDIKILIGLGARGCDIADAFGVCRSRITQIKRK